jgi:outer membrane protein assembly factor BamB
LRKTVSYVLLIVLVINTMALAVKVEPAKAQDADSWPMFHNDLAHSGYSASLAPCTNYTSWIYTTAAQRGVQSSPAVADGYVYVGASDGNVYALNASTGAFVWNYTTGGVVFSSPAVVGGVVYVGSEDNYVYALNAMTGALVWKYATHDVVDSSPAVVNGAVYVGSEDGNVYCLDASTGVKVWNYTTGGAVDSSPAVVGGVVYIGSDDENVYALNAGTGALIWNFNTTNFVESSPAVVGGVVYIGSGDGNVYALNAANGALKWNYTTNVIFLSSPAVADGMVFIGSAYPDFPPPTIHNTHTIHALNASNGALVWSREIGFIPDIEVDSSPAVADGLVYIVASFSNINALNETTGDTVWNFYTYYNYNFTGGGEFFYEGSSPAVADGKVFIGSGDGSLYAFGQVHAVAVTALSPSKTVLGQGYGLNLTVTASVADYPETFNVTVYANASALGTEEAALASGESLQMVFTWNTSGATYGNYRLSAYASPVANETIVANNNFTVGSVVVTIPGDLNGDFRVNLQDLVILANAYGSKPGDPNWNPNADIDGNGAVGLSDLVILAQHYGQHNP